MREIEKKFIVTVQPSFGQETTTEVMIFSKPTTSMLNEAEEVVREAQKNVASRVIDYDDYDNDSRYREDLESCASEIKLVAIRRKDDQPARAEHFLYSAKPGDEDDRLFRHTVHAADLDEADFLVRWHIALTTGFDPKADSEAFLDAMTEVQVEYLTSQGTTAPRLTSRQYNVWTPGAHEPRSVDITVPDSNDLFDDVIWAYALIHRLDPSISPTVYAGFGKIGPTKRFFAEARYTDGNDTPTYSDWFEAVDSEEAEFQARIETAVNQGCDESDLGSLIETARDIPVVDCHEEPTTKDEMLGAIRAFVDASEAGTNTAPAFARLKEIVTSADALMHTAQAGVALTTGRYAQNRGARQ